MNYKNKSTNALFNNNSCWFSLNLVYLLYLTSNKIKTCILCQISFCFIQTIFHEMRISNEIPLSKIKKENIMLANVYVNT